MQGMLIPLFLSALFMACIARGQVLIDTKFGLADDPVRVDADNAKGRVTGTLDPAWSDNSAWADVTVNYQKQTEEGRAFTRVETKAIRTGRVQLAHPLPTNDQNAIYVISMVARSPDAQAIDVGVRLSGPPYDFLWQRRVTLGGRWESFDFTLELPARVDAISMFIVQNSAGRFDLRSFKLERVTRQTLAQRMAEKGAVAGKNLVRVTRFGNGLPTGWSFNREASDDQIIIDKLTEPAIREGSAIRISSSQPFTLQSAPVELINPFVKHTMTIYTKGRGEFDFRVRSDGHENAALDNVRLTDQWQRLELVFDPRVGARWPVLEIEGTGSIDLDAFQCELGEKATGFDVASPVEVSIVSPRATKLYFDDELVRLSVMVLGASKPSMQINYRIYDVTNVQLMAFPKWIEDHAGFIEFDPMKLGRGSFRVEVDVTEGGKGVSNVDEVVFHVVRRPRFEGRDAPESNFGVHVEQAQRHLSMAKAIGINWVRLHDAGMSYTAWINAEPTPGAWTFFDRELDRYRANHLTILGTLTTAPHWASYFDKRRNDYFDQFYRPRDMKRFEQYVRQIVTRHKDRIGHWDVWNEPWIKNWWAIGYDESKPSSQGYLTSKEPQKDYVEMCRLTSDTVKSIAPSAKVGGVNTTTHSPSSDTMMAGDLWTKGVVEHGGHELADFITYHTYLDGKQLFPGDQVERGLQTAFGHLPQSAQSKPKWMTEGNVITSSIGQGLYRITTPGQTGENIVNTADLLVRFVVSLRVHGIEKIFLYSMHSHHGFGGTGEWRVFVCDDGSLHPCGVAFSTTAYHLDTARFVEMGQLGEALVYFFQRGEQFISVVSPRPATRGTFTIGGEARIENLWGNEPKDRQLIDDSVFYVLGTEPEVRASIATMRFAAAK